MHDDISSDEQLKTADSIFTPDFRTRVIGPNGKSLSSYIEDMSMAQLTNKVPTEVRIEFNVARNTYIYSHYCYRLSSAAQLYAFGVLEKALTDVLSKRHLIDLEHEYLGLGALLGRALSENLLTDAVLPNYFFRRHQGFTNGTERLSQFFQTWTASPRREGYQGKRNRLAHNPGTLDLPWQCAETIGICAAIITHLYDNLPAKMVD